MLSNKADGLTKVAKLSANGRKRENAALFTVLFLLFLFAAAAVSWAGIEKRTEKERKLDAYGEWKAAFYDVGEEQAERYAGNPMNTRSGVSRVVGSVSGGGARQKIEEILESARKKGGAESWGLSFWEKMARYADVIDMGNYQKDYLGICGTIGTLDAGCVELGRISMEEGRLPKAADEIALTRPLLLRLGLTEELGQEVSLEVVSKGGEVVDGSWKLSGIMGVYGGAWETAGYPLVSAVISEDGLAAFPWEFSCNVFTDVEGATGSIHSIYNTGAVEPVEKVKRFIFKKGGEDFFGREDGGDIWAMLLALSFVAAVAIFQITLTQMQKRSRQAGLLKAIGATDGQLRKIFLREVTGVLWKAAVSGTAAGAALVPAVLWGSGLAKKERLYYGLDLPLLLGAVAACCIMVWAGALLPVWKGSRIPVRGELMPKARRVRPMKEKKKYPVRRLVAGRENGTFCILSALSLALMLSSVFLASYQAGRALAPYRNGDKALYYHLDYNLLMQRYMDQVTVDNRLLEQLAQVPGVKAVYTRKNGVFEYGNFYISYDGIENCRLEQLRKERDVFPYSETADMPYKKKEGLALVNIMGIYSGWESNLGGIDGLVTEGRFDREAFEAGEEVLLFLPPYREMDNRNVGGSLEWLEFQTDRRYRDFYEEETCVKPGDTITLVVNEDMSYVSVGRNRRQGGNYAGTREIPVKVGGIIRYLPQDTENPLWNEDYTGYPWLEIDHALQPFTVVADGSLVNELRILDMEMRMDFIEGSLEEGEELKPWQIWTARGENTSSGMVGLDIPFNSIEVLCDTSASEFTRGSIESLAENYGLDFRSEEYQTVYEMWKLGYRKARDRSLFCLIAAATVVLVLVCILMQSMNERFMEERRRLGILQAMGVRWQEIRRGYLLKGLGNGLAALFLAHGVFFASAVWQGRGEVEGLSTYQFVSGREAAFHWFGLLFGGYSWKLHALACAFTLAFSAALYLMPLREILKKSPVENIRELGE